ncbi:serine O-acetyltransferase [Arcobacter sp. FWKO B]|uniref:serine O-acetyltransferase n=1 Tax=Arcobacter sp. FWKO B TaxID=2593672 RepID=UPI0018A63A1C|nr:serine O-acetyltransferase [Arcobacter sp. FWKO B]QOG13137.1 serine O-acetyltransferase [Arcobacter sp. FWKO B]
MSTPSLLELIKEDFCLPKNNDPAFRSGFELIFNYPGIWAIVNYRIANAMYKKGFKKIARFISGISQFFTNTDIHPACTIGRRVFIDHAFGVVIGETSVLGDDILIYQGVTLGGVSLSHGKRHPTICSNVTIGAGAKILGNITVGENSKIGANSVVITDVPSSSTAVGVPARIIKRKESKDHLAHNDLPDISKEMFGYLLKRVAILEHALTEKACIDINTKDHELEEIYKNFIDAMSTTQKN